MALWFKILVYRLKHYFYVLSAICAIKTSPTNGVSNNKKGARFLSPQHAKISYLMFAMRRTIFVFSSMTSALAPITMISASITRIISLYYKVMARLLDAVIMGSRSFLNIFSHISPPPWGQQH